VNVYLTFDIEIWCNGWANLDTSFPSSFQRYVYGRSRHGDYALPKTLEILNKYGLRGVFFVEPLFSARFGQQHLKSIVDLIRSAGQEVQLHLHTEWTNEALQPLIKNCNKKRQYLSDYTLDEQSTLIGYGKEMLESTGSGPITAFRAGSFALNEDTFRALAINGIGIDTSLNRCHDVSSPKLIRGRNLDTSFYVGEVLTYPVTVFRDGFGRDRPAQVGACSFTEMRDALWSAKKAKTQHFVVVSHNFEMLKSNSSQPDWTVVKRFTSLCAFLAEKSEHFCVKTFSTASNMPTTQNYQPYVQLTSTGRRYAEQAFRRLI